MVFTIFLIASLLFTVFDLIPSSDAVYPGTQAAEALDPEPSFFERYLHFLHDLSPIGYRSSADQVSPWQSLVAIDLFEGVLVIKTPYLGVSSHDKRLVNTMLADGLPETVVLVISTLLLTGFVAIPLGVAAARSRNGWLDRSVRVLNAFGLAVPSFVAAMFLAWSIGYLMNGIFGLPVTGNLFTYNVYLQREELVIGHLILPMLALSVRPISVATQLMRNSMVDVLDKAYIRTARAKGVPEYKVLMKHALINAMVPMLGALTGWVASLMAGAMFVEYVFGFKGIGTLLLKAIEHQDFPVVMGVTLLIVTVYIVSDEFIKVFLKKFNPSMQRA